MHNLTHQDHEHRRMALDATQSFIVQAPAGSGKTELLIQRLLTLLTYVMRPEEILAITFTKKSANEMRARVIKALKNASINPEPQAAHEKMTWHIARAVLKRDQQFNWHLINNPNQLRIQTIDSLCSHLTKQLPLLSHFGSQPDITDNAQGLYREAVQEVLTHLEENFAWSVAIATLLTHLDNDLNKLHDLLINLLAKRDQWLPYIHLEANDTDIRKMLEQNLKSVINQQLEFVASVFPDELMHELVTLLSFTSPPRADAGDLDKWKEIANTLLTKTFTWRKRVNVSCEFRDDETLRDALEALLLLPNASYHESQWQVLQSLLPVLKIVTAQLRVTFQQTGQIDFVENAQAALTALGQADNPTDLALALDYQIKHILVDEFQDTSFTQYQLLEKLTMGWEPYDGRTLFVVGDPMQSIYKFREAEVGLFIRMCHSGIGQLQLIPLKLSINFRSIPAIVDWNNRHFEAIFPRHNDIAKGAVTYSRSVSNQSNTASSDQAVHVHGFTGQTNSEAPSIVNEICRIKSQAPHDSIAILVRSRPHLADIIPALKKANIPYRAIDIDPLATRQPIQDLLSLTNALLHPADRIAWLALLRAPWCGLTLADLHVIAHDNPHTTIWEQLVSPPIQAALSTDGRARLLRILPILKTKIAERERYNLRYWIESAWLLLGGPACLQNSSDIDDANGFLNLLDTFEQQQQSININLLKDKIKRLYAPTQHDGATLQIMTIHTAKGLEFDHVFLPHLESRPQQDDSPLLLWMEQPLYNDKTALLLAPIHATGSEKDGIFAYIQRQQKLKAAYELDRLLYVAATRAKKNLYLFFNVQKNNNDEYRTNTGSFLDKLMPQFQSQLDDYITHCPLVSDPSLTDLTARQIMRLSPNWVNPLATLPSMTTSTHQQQTGFLLPDEQPRLVGTIVHRILQYISEQGTAWWTKQDEKIRDHYIQQQLLQAGIIPLKLAESKRLVTMAIQQTLNDKMGLWILHAHKDAKSEYSISALIDGIAKNIVIDRTFVDEQNIRWIIDYKTAATDADKDKYVEQLQQYAKAMRLMDDREIRLGVYFPMLGKWQEWAG